MKSNILIFLILIPFFNGYSETLYVSATGGLYLREKPNGAILKYLPYGTKLDLIEYTNVSSEYEGIVEKWVKIKRSGIEGYSFRGFLIRIPPPNNEISTLHDYIISNNSIKSSELYYKVHKKDSTSNEYKELPDKFYQYPKFDPDTEIITEIKKLQFTKGQHLELITMNGISFEKLFINDITKYEAFAILKYIVFKKIKVTYAEFLRNSDILCLYDSNSENTTEIKIESLDNGFVLSIMGTHLPLLKHNNCFKE
jgi:hypothetical protein